MKTIFISYRRKDTQDVVGRLFDRLTGYFGPGVVLMDVDALVAGGNYRTQITQLLKDCSVVLAVIGREWLTVKDETGRRRLDDPDDQLRIEIEIALSTGRTVIPVLVHDAEMPRAEELPESVRPLAACEPHYLQSGTSFNADVWHLVVRLEDAGVRPLETRFPWHTALMTAGILLLISVLGLASWSKYENETDYVLQQVDATKSLPDLGSALAAQTWDGRPYDLARFDRRLLWDAASIYLPLTIGPMLIVWGKRLCCRNKERFSGRLHHGRGAGRLPLPKSKMSVWCLALGVASLGAGMVTAIPALIVGVLAWREIGRHATWIRGRSLIVFGLLAALGGGAVSLQTYWPTWKMRRWIASMESAHAAGEKQDDAAQLAALEQATQLAGSDFRRLAVAKYKQAQALRRQGKDEEAVSALTTAIDAVEASTPETGPTSEVESIVWQDALALRAEIYEATGQADAAAQDQRALERGFYNRGAADEQSSGFEEAPPAPPPPSDE